MLPVLRAVYRAGGRGRAAHLVLLSVLGLFIRVGALVCTIVWGGSYFTFALIGLIAVGVAHRALRVWLHIDITAAMLRAVLRGTLLRAHATSRPGDEALVVVSEAVHHGALALVDLSTAFAADVVAVVIAIAILAFVLPGPVLVAAIVVTLIAGTTVVSLRKGARRRAEVAFEAHAENLDVLADAFEGGTEIVVSGARADWLRRGGAGIDAWKRLALRSEASNVLVGRLPLVVACAIGTAVLLVTYGASSEIVRHAIVLLGAAPPFVSLIRSIGELAKLEPRVTPLVQLPDEDTNEHARTNASAVAWEGITHEFGAHRVLENVDVRVSRGQLVGFAGPNGAGKSTMFRVACGLLEPEAGRFTIDAKPGVCRGPWLPQRPYLLPRRTIRDAIAFPFESVPDDEAQRALRRVNLWMALRTVTADPLSLSTDTLSAGERQRLALARVLLRDADVYLLDEPDANLDAAGIVMVGKLLRELADAGKIVVVAAHTPEILAVADRVVHLDKGKVTAIEERSGTPSVRRKVAES